MTYKRKHDTDKSFIADIEYLELIKRLIAEGSSQTLRAAFYLADQFVEILMFRLLKDQISRDSELIVIFNPQIDQEKINEINRFYDEKIKWLCKLKYLNDQDREKIKFVHSYRNLSYHKEIEDPNILPVLASLGLANALKLFKNYYDIGATELFSYPRARILAKYSLPIKRINYAKASDTIKRFLQKGLLNKARIEKILKGNIGRRLQVIADKRGEVPWLRKDSTFNDFLKIAEFFETNPHDELSKEVYEINYEVIRLAKGGRKVKDKTAAKLRKKRKLKEGARDKNISKLLATYKQTTSLKSLKLANNFLIAKFPNLQNLISRYKELDKQIRTIEFLVEIIEEEFDRSIQMNIDQMRGK